MSTIVVPPNCIAVVDKPIAQDDTDTTRATSSATATLSDTTNAYIALRDGKVVIVTNPTAIPAEGTSVNINLTFSGTSANGGALPDLVYPVQLYGPPAPPSATHFVGGPVVVTDKIGQTIPADPGTATITL